MKDWIREQFSGELDTFFSSREFLEIMPRGLNKGAGLIQMAELLGVERQNTVAVGDEENDITMITAAGTGCAMANAIESVRQAADYVTVLDNNHGGAAEVIRRFILS